MSNPKAKRFVIGLDVGYSGMKAMCENKRLSIPGYVKKADSQFLIHGAKDILYRDDVTNELYMVGFKAQESIDIEDTSDADSELYSRKRYSNKKFKILINTAIAICLMGKADNRELFIETGLPPAFMADEQALKKVLTTFSPFSIQIGNGKWQAFHSIVVKEENIHVITQPAGTLYSTVFKNDGNYIPNVESYLESNTIILDFGFNTYDPYGIQNGMVVLQESLMDYGMKAILEKTSRKILAEYGIDVRISALQKYLTTGEIPIENLEEMKSENKKFDFLLEQASNETLQSAILYTKTITGGFRGYKNIVVSGGTGEAWFDRIANWLVNMKTLTVMPSNINDKLPFVYSNARGFYMYACATCK